MSLGWGLSCRWTVDDFLSSKKFHLPPSQSLLAHMFSREETKMCFGGEGGEEETGVTVTLAVCRAILITSAFPGDCCSLL